MALPSTGITMIAVAKTLGYYAYPLYLSLLCKHQNINKWSKWKPISTSAATLTDAVIKTNNYGYSNYTSTNPQSILTWSANNTLYNYVKPSGTSSSPYRLGDFRKYNTDAVEPYTITCEKAEGYRDMYEFTASPNAGAEITMDDIFPATAHTGASLVLIDKSKMVGSDYNYYTLKQNIVVNNQYDDFTGYATINSTQDSSNYIHDAVMAIKDGSTYCAIPSSPFTWFEPLLYPQISLDSGSTWINLDGTSAPEITIYQGNGNNATVYVRTGFDIDVYGLSWLHPSPSSIPASTVNPPQSYPLEIICDTATAFRTGEITFQNIDYGLNEVLTVKQSVAVPNIRVTCSTIGYTEVPSRFALFTIRNLSGQIGATATVSITYTLSGGGIYTSSKIIEIGKRTDIDYTTDITMDSVDDTEIVSAYVTISNVGTITYVANTYMDNQGNLIL